MKVMHYDNYAAVGYVCRHLRSERIMSLKNRELLLFLMALVKDDSSGEGGNEEEWTRKMDRGGLWYIKETTYTHCLFQLKPGNACKHCQAQLPNLRKKYVIKSITSSEDVLFYWLIASADFETDDDEVLEVLLQNDH